MSSFRAMLVAVSVLLVAALCLSPLPAHAASLHHMMRPYANAISDPSSCDDSGVQGYPNGTAWTDVNYITCNTNWPSSITTWVDGSNNLCGIQVYYTNGQNSGSHGCQTSTTTVTNFPSNDRITNITWYGDGKTYVVGLQLKTLHTNSLQFGNIQATQVWNSADYFSQANTYVSYFEGRQYTDTSNNAHLTGLGVGYVVSTLPQAQSPKRV